MKNTIEVWVIKDPKGSMWKTPKGKFSWTSKGAAKNAWGCHKNPSSKYSWVKDAEPLGWTVEKIAKYELVK